MTEPDLVEIPKAQRVLAFIFGPILVVVGGVCCALAFRFIESLEAQNAVLDDLKRENVTVWATITDRTVETVTNFPAMTSGGPRTATESRQTRYDYQFEAQTGEIITGSGVVGRTLGPDIRTIRYYYEPSNPSVNAPFYLVEKERWGLNFDTLANGVVFLILTVLGLLFGGAGLKIVSFAIKGKMKPNQDETTSE